ncbi:MAG: ABC transporter permease [Candidatus Limiplasma sp.]|nr:ABC transporter permease [Candidatus Limiplasma sp.]
MSELFSTLLFQNTLRTATPVVLAALGCLLTQHVNITNIGIEGMMLIGAFFAVLGSYLFGSWLMGLALAMAVGALLGLFYYVFVIKFGSDEFIIGVALNIFAGGLTVFLLRTLFRVKGSFSGPGIVPLPTLTFPLLAQIPLVGPLLSGNTLLVYVSWLLVPVLWLMIYKTPLGFHLRSAGEYPEALRAAGKNPNRMKCLASVLCGVLSALAGAHLSLGYLTMFTENMSASRGYVAFACVIFGRGNPPRVFLAALLFGFIYALGLRLQKLVPSDLTSMAPYVVTVIMMVAVVLLEKRRKKRMARVLASQNEK